MLGTIPDKTLRELGWPALTAHLARRTRTPLGEARALALPFLDDEGALDRAQSLVREARALTAEGVDVPLADALDCTEHLERARRDGILEPLALLSVARLARATSQARRFLCARADALPLLAELADALPDPAPLAAELERAFEPSGAMADTASPALGELRERVRGLHRAIKKRLDDLLVEREVSEMLRESYYSIRNDRYVLPIRAEHRSHFPGIVHNASGSGQTLFIEPSALLELGNQLTIAQSLALEEERRILAMLSAAVAERAPELFAAQGTLAELDTLGASARLADALDAHPPQPSRDGTLMLEKLRHPLLVLRGVKVIANDVRLGAAQRALVVSGPNAGGKTVTITAVGLCTLMARAGLPIPAAPGATLPPFRTVYCAIGDAQDLAKDLSTFTAHLQALKTILESVEGAPPRPAADDAGTQPRPHDASASDASASTASASDASASTASASTASASTASASTASEDGGDPSDASDGRSEPGGRRPTASPAAGGGPGGPLILIDEIAAGTGPTEGAALAVSVLTELVERGARVLVTTHLEAVKALALADDRFAAAAVGFDLSAMAPTYRLALGEAGRSSAVEIARRVGLPAEVCDRAQKILSGESGSALERALAALDAERGRLAQARDAMDAQAAAAREAEARLDVEREAVATRMRAIQAEARAELVADIERSRAEVRAMVAELQRAGGGATMQQVVAAQAALAEREASERAQLSKTKTIDETPREDRLPEGASIEVGMRVRLARLGRDGEVLEVDVARGAALVAVGALKSRVPLSELTPLRGRAPAAKFKRPKEDVLRAAAAARPQPLRSPNRTLDLRGARADEAVKALDEFLDQLVQDGAPDATIVHGHGTGALKAVVRERLAETPGVDGFRPGANHEGGDGATIVTLK